MLTAVKALGALIPHKRCRAPPSWDSELRKGRSMFANILIAKIFFHEHAG